MAGVSTPEMAAAVSDAGGLGSIAVGAAGAGGARAMIDAVRAATDRPFNVNLFCHRPARRDGAREAAWLARLAPLFAVYGVPAPTELHEIYSSFVEDDAMLELLIETRPPIVSFHFGLPPADRIAALRGAGIALIATVTSVEEARACASAGIDAIVAQGFEAGGHRGQFDPEACDQQLGTMVLARLLVKGVDMPVIAAGGIMDGAGVAAALALGAEAAQLGTAFIACSESSAGAAYREALAAGAATKMTPAVSGRPARSLASRFTALPVEPAELPDYPVAYDAAKALDRAARARGEPGFGALWAGQGAPLARAMPAAELVAELARELAAARAGKG